MNVPRRVPPIVDRAIRLGWEVSLSRPTDQEVDLYLRQPDGLGYAFSLRWTRQGDRWSSPRAQNIETVTEYLTRMETERKAS